MIQDTGMLPRTDTHSRRGETVVKELQVRAPTPGTYRRQSRMQEDEAMGVDRFLFFFALMQCKKKGSCSMLCPLPSLKKNSKALISFQYFLVRLFEPKVSPRTPPAKYSSAHRGSGLEDAKADHPPFFLWPIHFL